MTAIAEMFVGENITHDGPPFPIWSPNTPTVVFEKPAMHPPRAVDTLHPTDQEWAEEQYAADHARTMYAPVRDARETAMQATDAKVAHVLYTDGKPTPGVPFEGYAQTVDDGGKHLTYIHQAFDPRVVQDLALKAEEAREAAAIAQNTLKKVQTGGDFGAALLAGGYPIAAFVKGAGRLSIPTALLLSGGLVLSACGGAPALENPTAHPPTLPPEPTHIPQALSAAQETGAMIAQTPEGRAFYQALNTHGVDPSACSPDVLGKLVNENKLSLGEVSGLTTIATDALDNTPEPDHLTGIVCDVKESTDGTQTVSFFFTSDIDHTGDGRPDIYIPSQSKVLLPGQLIDGMPQVVVPVDEGQPPVGLSVSAPDWRPAGGEIPVEIRDLMTVEEESIRASLTAQGIDPNSILIHDVFRGSGNDFRMGSGITNLNQTIAFYPKFDDITDGFAWRPDLRLADRPWHWQTVSLPEGVNGKIEVVFDPKSEAPQFVVLTPDESKMIGWFNNITGQWLTVDGEELMPPPPPTPEPTATPAELLGGDKTSVVFSISYGHGPEYTIPPEVQPYLTPTTPEQWKVLPMPTRVDGIQIPWGKLVTMNVATDLGSYTVVVAPVLIRGVVEIRNTGQLGGTFILPVYELPAQGGSNFLIPEMQKNPYSTSPNADIDTLKDGIPADWIGGKVLDLQTYYGLTSPRMVNGADLGAELRKHVGEIVLIKFVKSGDPIGFTWNGALESIMSQKLASPSGQVETGVFQIGLILTP